MAFPDLSIPDGLQPQFKWAIGPRDYYFSFAFMSLCLFATIEVSQAADKGVLPENKSSTSETRLDVVPRSPRPTPSPLAGQFQQLDPAKSGWSSEAIGDAINRQLKQLGKLLEHPKQIDEVSVRKLATSNINFGQLRPTELREVFSDNTTTVRRVKSSSAGDQEVVLKGIDAFIQSLHNLVEPFDPSSEIRVTFKVFKVGSEEGAVVVQVFFQATGMASQGRLQQQAVWSCRWSYEVAKAPPKLSGIEIQDYEEVSLSNNLERLFSDCTESVLGGNASFHDQLAYGIDHWRSRIEKHWGIEVTGYQGMALGDVNNDGLDDLYLLQPGGLPNRLFVQNPDGTATDRSAAAGVDWLDRSSSALFVDFDNDGDQDLVLASDYNLLFLANDGQGNFQRKLTERTHAIPRSMCAADYDLDGRVDLYVCYAMREVRTTEKVMALPLPIHDANNGARNVLYRNEGDWIFRDVTASTGLEVNNSRFSWAAAFEDFDNDGDQDLYVANDFGRNNLYRNDAGRFVDIAPDAAVEDSSAGMSVSWGDYNRDGHMDLYVSNMFSAAGNRIAYQRKFQGDLDDASRRTFQRHARGNSLFENTEDGTFSDVSPIAAVSMGRWAWGSLFADINNDGWEDLLVANGYVTQDNTRDL